MDYEEDDLLRPTTFKEKLKDEIPDLMYATMAIVVLFFVISSRPEQAQTTTKTIHPVEKVQEIDQTKTILINDSVRGIAR